MLADEIAVRVDKGQAVPAFQILERHVLQERRFSRAGLADDVEVQETVFVLDPEDPLVVVKINAREARDVVCTHTGRIFLPTGCARETGSFASTGAETSRVS